MRIFLALMVIGSMTLAGCDSSKPLPTSKATVPNPTGGKGPEIKGPPAGPGKDGGEKKGSGAPKSSE